MKSRLLVSAGVLVFALLAPVTVQAQDATTETTTDTTSALETRQEAKQHAADARKSKETRIAEIKSKIEARKAELKADACERNVAKIQRQQTNIGRKAGVIKGVFDKKYDRLVEFYESGQLTTPDYDTLVEAIELAKANVEASTEALATYEFELDCEAEDAAEQLDSYREAVVAVKTDLKAYKKSLVDLISSLKSANTAQNSEESEDGDVNDTNETANEGAEGETTDEE